MSTTTTNSNNTSNDLLNGIAQALNQFSNFFFNNFPTIVEITILIILIEFILVNMTEVGKRIPNEQPPP